MSLLQPTPTLPAAIPPPSEDIAEAWKMIGQKELRIVQLMTRIMEIAAEANRVDDERLVLIQVKDALAVEVESGRKRIAELEEHVGQLNRQIAQKEGRIGSRRKKK
jgi:hypothetical protein